MPDRATGQTIALRVLTQDRLAVEDTAVSIVAPGEAGYLGILRHHAPLVTTLGRGRLSWKRPDGASRSLQVDSGFLEVVRDRVTVLTTLTDEPEAVPHR